MKRKFVFTGGGTGGHVSPAIAISEALRKMYPNSEFRYVGKAGKVEEDMVPKEWSNYASVERQVRFVSTTSGSLKNPKVLFQLGLGFVQAAAFLMRYRPDAIIATGGYVSAPIVIAGGILRKCRLLKSKMFIHEANADLGRMNKLALKFADKVAVSFPGTKVPNAQKVLVGYPVRKRLVVKEAVNKVDEQVQARETLNLPLDAKVIFAFGGSQGARTINRGLVDSLPVLLADPNVYVLHGTGKKMPGNAYYGKDDVKARLTPELVAQLPSDWEERYRYTDFIDNMGAYYSATDLVICRGGAGSLVEVCANGLPSITIPKANLSGDHQAVNARVLERLGATKVVYERVDILSGDAVESIETSELCTIVFDLLNDSDKRAKMGQAARLQYDSETSELCGKIVGGLLGDCEIPESKPEPELSKETVLGKLDNELEAMLKQVHKGKRTLTEVERQLVLYKLDVKASSSGLVPPARACRMFGLGRFTERLDVLLNFACNPKKSPFTRRDACVGLGTMGVLNQNVVDCLLKVVQEDDYFEAVNEALSTLYTLFKNCENREGYNLKAINDVVRPLSRSREFDFRMNALGLMSLLCTNFDEVRESFEANYFHPNWQVRKRIVECFSDMLSDGRISKSEVEDVLHNRFLQTSSGFDIHFRLKEKIIELHQQDTRNEFLEDFQSVLYSNASKEDKAEQLKGLASKVKQEGLELEVDELLNEVVQDESDGLSVIERYRNQVKAQAQNPASLVALKKEILNRSDADSLQTVVTTIEFLLGEDGHVVSTR